jgi:hypothetical protein
MEVTDETDGEDAGDPEDAIWEGVFGMDGEAVDTGVSGRDFGGM